MFLAAFDPVQVLGAAIVGGAGLSLLAVARYERKGLRAIIDTQARRTEDLEGDVDKATRAHSWCEYRLTGALQVLRQQGVVVPPALFQDMPKEGEEWPTFHLPTKGPPT